MNSIIGQVLLWAGFLSGALATVFATGNYSRLGINVADNPDTKAVFVKSIDESSNAYESGLRAEDQLLSFAGDEIKSASAFGKMLGGFASSEPVDIVYRRDEQESTIQVVAGDPWNTVNWMWYLVSAGVCIGGIVFLRMGRKTDANQSEKNEANLKQIKAHLADLVNRITKLNEEVGKLTPRQILNVIEGDLADDFRGFADGRDAITAEHGLETFAAVMTQFASGERALNRAWSAAADGYVEEAARCIEHGLAMLKSAKKLLDAA